MVNIYESVQRLGGRGGGGGGGGGGGVGDHCTLFKNQHFMLITNKSTFYSTLLGMGGGGLAKEYSLYAFINVDNFERPLMYSYIQTYLYNIIQYKCTYHT